MQLTRQEQLEILGLSEETIEGLKVFFGHIYELIEKVWEVCRLVARQYAEYLKVESARKRQHHKLSFARPVIRHQVINRKPRHLIKKII